MINTTKLIERFFSPPNDGLFLPNEYTPPKGIEGLRIEKTVEPDERAGFNEVYKNAKEQLKIK